MAAPTDTPEFFNNLVSLSWFGRLRACVVMRLAKWFVRTLVRFRVVWRVPGGPYLFLGFDVVQECFARHQDFPVINAQATDALAWAPPFLLAIPDFDDPYKNMHRITRDVFAPEGSMLVLAGIADNAFANRLPEPPVGGQNNTDLVWDYMYPGFFQIIEEFYGIDIAEADRVDYVCALLVVSGLFFGSSTIDPAQLVHQRAGFSRAWEITKARVEYYHANQGAARGAMARALADAAIGDDIDSLTSYFLGMILGFLPTSGNAHGRIVELLWRRPEGMAWAERYLSNDGEFLATLHEALRLNYILPALFRRANKDTVVADGTPSSTFVPNNALIALSGYAAMHDPARVHEPRKFLPDRSNLSNLNYGFQMHYCVGWDISNVVMIAFFRPLVARKFSKDPNGRTLWAGAFPWQMDVRYGRV